MRFKKKKKANLPCNDKSTKSGEIAIYEFYTV